MSTNTLRLERAFLDQILPKGAPGSHSFAVTRLGTMSRGELSRSIASRLAPDSEAARLRRKVAGLQTIGDIVREARNG